MTIGAHRDAEGKDAHLLPFFEWVSTSNPGVDAKAKRSTNERSDPGLLLSVHYLFEKQLPLKEDKGKGAQRQETQKNCEDRAQAALQHAAPIGAQIRAKKRRTTKK